MNHLRGLLESLNHYALGSGGIPAEALHEHADWCQAFGESAVCFSMGDVASVLELTTIETLVRLPFRTCWFECEVFPPSAPGTRMIAGLLVNTDNSGRIGGQVWTEMRGKWKFQGTVTGNESDPWQWECNGFSQLSADSTHLQVRATQAFLSALHCSNVRRQEHAPSPKLQKARAKRGKAPLFSYWTLELNGSTGPRQNLGGTHASPRVHLRRGHPRQYAPGQWTWVQPHAVGNRAVGMVHKDYSAGRAFVADGRRLGA